MWLSSPGQAGTSSKRAESVAVDVWRWRWAFGRITSSIILFLVVVVFSVTKKTLDIKDGISDVG